MDKLRPVAEVADAGGWIHYQDRVELIQAERDAIVQACADVAIDVAEDVIHPLEQTKMLIRQAILAVAVPPETMREQLGRTLYKSFRRVMSSTEWDELSDYDRESYCDHAEVFIAELDKIREEQKL